ncbi:MAG: hypothetical protein U0836_27150 [Pirellulales bacterium]
MGAAAVGLAITALLNANELLLAIAATLTYTALAVAACVACLSVSYRPYATGFAVFGAYARLMHALTTSDTNLPSVFLDWMLSWQVLLAKGGFLGALSRHLGLEFAGLLWTWLFGIVGGSLVLLVSRGNGRKRSPPLTMMSVGIAAVIGSALAIRYANQTWAVTMCTFTYGALALGVCVASLTCPYRAFAVGFAACGTFHLIEEELGYPSGIADWIIASALTGRLVTTSADVGISFKAMNASNGFLQEIVSLSWIVWVGVLGGCVAHFFYERTKMHGSA